MHGASVVPTRQVAPAAKFAPETVIEVPTPPLPGVNEAIERHRARLSSKSRQA